MKKKWLKDKKGFTLVELIVVLVILAILIALLVPALTGYIDKARQKAKMTECRLVVEAAQTCLSEMYGASEGADISSLQASLNQSDMVKAIRDLAEVPGEISGNILITDNAAVKYLRYIAKDGTIVIYEKEHNPEYRIDEEGARYSEDAPGYWKWASELSPEEYSAKVFLDKNNKVKEEYKKYGNNWWEVKENASRRLQMAYLERYGSYQSVDWNQIKLPNELTPPDNSASYVWKPIAAKDGEKILVAESGGKLGGSYPPIVYYNGNYYYNLNGGGTKLQGSYVGDKEEFDVADLGKWKKI